MDFLFATVVLIVGGLFGGALAWLFLGERLGGQAKEAEAENQRLHDQLVTSQKKLGKSRDDRKSLTSELRKTTAENEQLTDLNNSLTQRVAIAEADNNALRQRLDTADGQADTIKEENEQIRQQLTIAAAHLKKAQEEAGIDDANQQELIARLKEENEAYKIKLDTTEEQVTNLVHELAETKHLRDELAEKQEELVEVSEKVDVLKVGIETHRDLALQANNNLEALNGIGPTYANRLREAGIETLADLVEQPPERLAEIVGLKTWQGGKPEEWIVEARRLAGEIDD